MSLRHGILGLLASRPLSGYDLTREFDLTLGHVWSAGHSQIYPELGRLAAEGLIEPFDSGPRGRKRYAATKAGRAEVLRWLREDDPGRELRVESLLQGFFYWMLEPAEQIALIARERARHASKLAGYEALATGDIDWMANAEQHAQRIMLEAGIRYERGLVEWADWAAAEVGRGRPRRRGAVVSDGFELDVDTALVDAGGGRYDGELVERWNVGVGMNGGYLAVYCLRAVLAESEWPDPLSMTVHYLSRPEPGPASVQVTAMRVGRGHATYRFDLLQGSAGELRATGLVLTGRLRDAGPHDFAPKAPQGLGPDESSSVRRVSAPGESVSLWGRLDTRIARADDIFFLRTEPGEARTGGWTRLADGRPTDVLCVPLFLDCWPPAVFSRTMRPDGAGAPTLELTIHWRHPVPSGWLNARFHSRQLAGGYLDENGELWSEGGIRVAESRQLARYSAAGGGFS